MVTCNVVVLRACFTGRGPDRATHSCWTISSSNVLFRYAPIVVSTNLLKLLVLMTGCASDRPCRYGRSVACGKVYMGAEMLGTMNTEFRRRFPSLVLIEICMCSLFNGVLEPNVYVFLVM